MTSVLTRYQNRNSMIGDTKMSARIDDHDGWLVCDGRTVSATKYQKLFNAIAYTYGGSGANFRLPDMRGRVAGAIGAGAVTDSAGRALTNRTPGTYTGEEVHLLSTTEMPAHTHTTANTVVTDGNGTTTEMDSSIGTTEINLATTQTTTSSPTGEGAAHNNMQPTLFLGHLFIYSGLHEK